MHHPDNLDLRRTRSVRQQLPASPDVYKSKSSTYLFAKRAFDIVLSLLVVALILWWLLPILAILIKLDSRGPVFFVQKRIGLLGKTFNCLKLRTMVVNTQADTEQADKNDPRITPLGRFLRTSCMDELPQFFNVLIGDMSVVGPRPHMLKDCEEFSRLVPSYALRQFLRPGITGMAQVKGYRGKTKGFFDVFHRYQWDVFYVRNANFMLDLRLINKTIGQTFSAVFRVSDKEINTVTAVKTATTPGTEPVFVELKNA
ncbi:MAG TPA: sugar transferase [Chitinophagaceae bacterium]|jgi:putative colanic acid biosynthesis UDP-glucose lipid carrier transferase